MDVKRKLEERAEQLGALGHPARLAILRHAVQAGPEGASAGELQSKLDIPASTLSHHIDRLARTGLLQARREGTFIYYSAVFTTLRALTDYLWEDCCKGGKADPSGCC
ncbi:MAG: Arsenical resistance operon repressor [Labilithrix sp.]|nr:Arsenical resistance operon repressor [Labilithrix sp.]